jgi:hypothetical protein
MPFPFGETFDRYTGPTTGALPLTTHYTIVTTLNSAVSLTAGRFGGQAVRLTAESNQGFFTEANINRPLEAPLQEMATEFAFRRSDFNLATTGAGVVIWRARSGVNVQLVIGVDFLGRLLVGRTNFTTGLIRRSDPGLFDGSSWYSITPEIEFDPAAGRVSVCLDGVEILSETNVNTDPLGVGEIDSFELVSQYIGGGGQQSIDNDFDDMYVRDVASRYAQPLKGEVLFVNSDLGPNQWTRNAGASDFAAIDDAVSDGDATVLASSVAGDNSAHGLTDLSTVPALIPFLQVSTVARKTDAGLVQIRANLVSGPTTANGATQTMGLDFDERLDPYEADPDTASAWNATSVNALDVELERTA